MSEKVKTKVIELLYSWTLALAEESKIKDAYHMLKRQGTYLPGLSLRAAPEAAKPGRNEGCLPETVGGEGGERPAGLEVTGRPPEGEEGQQGANAALSPCRHRAV